MRVNVDLLRQRAEEIRQAIDRLQRYRELSREEFLGNPQTADAAKYRLIVAVEAAISICTHLAARLGRMARFCNLIVHGYGQVDDGRVWDILHRDLGDLGAYLSEISKTLQQEL